MKPEDHKTGFDSMLRQGLASDAPRDAKDCPDADMLAAYYERSLAAEEIAQFDTHLVTCSRCRAQMAALVRLETPARKPTERLAFWVFDWRWLAPVVAALAIIVLWAGIRERRNASNPPVMVATNRNESAAPAPAPPPPPIGTIESVPQKKSAGAMADKPTGAPIAGVAGGAGSPRRLAMEAKVAPAPPPMNSNADEVSNPKNSSSSAPSVGTPASAQVAPLVPTNSAGGRPSVAPAESAQGSDAGAAGASAIASKEAVPALPGATSKIAKRQYANRAAAPAHSAPALGGVMGGLIQTTTGAPKVIVIATPDASKSWRIADSGAIEFSGDAGTTWVTQYAPPPGAAVAGYAPSVNVCWIIGHAGLVFRTVNGSDWRQVAVPTTQDLTAVHALDAKHATVTAADGTLYVTKNGGKSWTPQNNP